MPDQTLLDLLDEVRGKTLRVVDGVSPQQARWAPPGLQNTILWHAGHSYVLLEWLGIRALGQPTQIPEGWFEMFSWESRPAAIAPDRWPSLEAVALQLEQQHQRMHTLLRLLPAEPLSAPSPHNPNRTVRGSIVHGLHDEACHTGEILLLRKLLAQKG